MYPPDTARQTRNELRGVSTHILRRMLAAIGFAVLGSALVMSSDSAHQLKRAINLPPPLSPRDGVHTFTYDSVQRRLPLIIEAVITNNPEFSDTLITDLRSLANEISGGKPLTPLRVTQDGWPEVSSNLPYEYMHNCLYLTRCQLTCCADRSLSR